MYPNLISFGGFQLHTYGVLTALGLVIAAVLAQRRAKREGIDPEHFLDAVFWVVAAGLVGARLLYVIVSWKDFASDPLGVFRVWEGGLVFYGGLLAGLGAAWYFVRRFRLPFWPSFDAAAPYIPLAHAFGRLGCFFNGCCFGRTQECGGVVFPSLGDGLPHLPTQLYEAGFNLLLFGALVLWRSKRRFPGQLFWTYTAAYAVGRFVLEIFRGDEIRGRVLLTWLHTSQFIALGVFALSVFMLAKLWRDSRSGRAS